MVEENTGDKLEKICLETYGYSPACLVDLNDVFEDCHKTIHYYLERSQGFAEDRRKTIIDISFKADLILLNLSKAMFISDYLVNTAKQKLFLKKTVSVDHGKQEELNKLIQKLRSNLLELLDEMIKFVEEAREEI